MGEEEEEEAGGEYFEPREKKSGEDGESYRPPVNAATLLADYMDAWLVPAGSTPESHRNMGGEEETTVDEWREFVNAVELVKAVDDHLQGMEAGGTDDVSMFWDSLPRWYEAAYLMVTPFQSTSNSDRPVAHRADINLLRSLGSLIRARRPYTVDEGQRDRLLSLLQQTREVLEGDEANLPADLKVYLWSRVEHVERVVRALDLFGSETARRLAFELGGALTTEAAKALVAGDESRSNAYTKVGWGFMGGASGAAGGRLVELVETGVKMLGGGN